MSTPDKYLMKRLRQLLERQGRPEPRHPADVPAEEYLRGISSARRAHHETLSRSGDAPSHFSKRETGQWIDSHNQLAGMYHRVATRKLSKYLTHYPTRDHALKAAHAWDNY